MIVIFPPFSRGSRQHYGRLNEYETEPYLENEIQEEDDEEDVPGEHGWIIIINTLSSRRTRITSPRAKVTCVQLLYRVIPHAIRFYFQPADAIFSLRCTAEERAHIVIRYISYRRPRLICVLRCVILDERCIVHHHRIPNVMFVDIKLRKFACRAAVVSRCNVCTQACYRDEHVYTNNINHITRNILYVAINVCF